MLIQLVFDEDFFKYILEKEGEQNYGRIISRLLFHSNGAITKFVLYIEGRCKFDVEDINRILLLSKHQVRDLALRKVDGPPLKLPTHFFSCLELKHLALERCGLDPPSSFHGFPNLSRLKLCSVQFEDGKFGELFIRSPVLEILYLDFTFSAHDVENAKLTNLKMLYLRVCNRETTRITSPDTIIELVGFLPKLQELRLIFHLWKSFTEHVARKKPSTTLPCLKIPEIAKLDLDNDIMLSFTMEIVKSSPNLQDLCYILLSSHSDVPLTHAICSPEVDYHTMGSLQLRIAWFVSFNGSENEICFIKYLLACSPLLKKIGIMSEEEVMLDTKLLKLPRASPSAKIFFKC
ncbi:F-box/FBD/LRR-repeat protein At1g13570-like [Bidens hawaiensis]|uniref:F-box/FBD/LRR-repeat protein At1g13570-like n=1 Tax=Bidens hawaiensis TaxID=980011 RepID=UPI00404A1E42